MNSEQILWDWGTAYDLFVSLEVLHEPADFGVRGAWAAGVRARLPSAGREMLEAARELVYIPFHWIYSLPEPKDGNAVLWALSQLSPAERLPALTLGPDYADSEIAGVLKTVADKGTWNEQDRDALENAYQCAGKKAADISPEKMATSLDWWARAPEFGDRYLNALRAYYEVFFAEEERRIRPALQDALSRAQGLAKQMTLRDLLEELSQGVRFGKLPEPDQVVLAPSYWCTPLIFYGMAVGERRLWLFGARPADASLVPGEVVPDALMRALKALSDPTRLRILHYLSEEPQTPAQLARRLRLRAPTVTHHLKTLRLAGLVQMIVKDKKEARHYAARPEAVAAACDTLKGFLGESDPE